ncbi:MAG: exo-alpha-sialidase [Clostridia bacterium]|nr:exo-alpha-sialidase [Clostridia bacterium]
MKHSIVSRITEGAFRYQAWPTLTRGEDGTLYVGASGHRRNHICPFGTDVMYVSCDEGESWTCPIIINDTWLDNRDAGMLAWGDGNLLLSWACHPPKQFELWEEPAKTKPHYDVLSPLSLGMRELWKTLPEEEVQAGSFTRISRDGGKTWSPNRSAPVSSPHGPCRLEDGTLLYIGSYMGENNNYANNDAGRIRLYESHDDGETWTLRSVMPMPEGADEMLCYEPHAAVLQDGTLMAAVRYHWAKGHGNRKMFINFSHDQGKTWGESRFLDVWGCPPHILQHSSGAIVLAYSKRLDVMGQYVIVSRDGGKTWSEETLISAEAPDWDHGYPSSVELPNGDIFTVFYQKCPGDDYNSLHSVRWNLDEVK